MGVLTAFLALLSCALVGTGVWLVLRDVRRSQALRVEHGPAQAVGLQNEPAPTAPPSPTAIPSAPSDEGPEESIPERAHAIDWRSAFETSLGTALRAVNGAFAPAGVALVQAPASAAPSGLDTQDYAIALVAQEQPAGHLHIQVAGDEVEIVAAPLLAREDKVRRVRRLRGAEASVPILAEAIAACAWPVVAAVAMPARR